MLKLMNLKIIFFFDGTTARGGPSPLLQYTSKLLDPLLCFSIHLFPSFSGPWTRHPAILETNSKNKIIRGLYRENKDFRKC